jgi:hypothetical protein
MFAAVYLKASCILLITVNVKVNLLTALLMYTGLVHDWLKGDRRRVARKVWSLHDSRLRRHTLMQNRIASVYLLLSTDSYYDPVGTR